MTFRITLAAALCLIAVVGISPSPSYADSNPGQIATCGKDSLWLISANNPVEGGGPNDHGDNFCISDEPGKIWLNDATDRGPWLNAWNWVALVNPTPNAIWIKGIAIRPGAPTFQDCLNGGNVYYLHGRDAQPLYWLSVRQAFLVKHCPTQSPDVVAVCGHVDPDNGWLQTNGTFEVTARYTEGGSGASSTSEGAYYPFLHCFQSQGLNKNPNIIDWHYNAWQNRAWFHQDADDAYGQSNCYDSGYMYYTEPSWALLPRDIDLTLNPASCYG